MNSTKTLAIETPFICGDVVYQRVNSDRRPGMVTAINMRTNQLTFEVSWPNGCMSWHHDYELTTEFIPDFEP